ncbi:hypothetical protein OH773_08685 [Buttiauxella sp. WJP83]|uniref:hypothetical protein n=1 Tax=unclassified Buttiauxella TaxID=2634062 RepID=UPI0010DA60A7|nr:MULTISPECIES: hypothetical protein [unclassified Buttiauxella]WBM72292.1 hypothetical protein OH773_08685 [Buttiauxella sp. WJP83]GDX04310.1 helix-turn-helix domain-containing protein [Buttiauxella sp. A111]
MFRTTFGFLINDNIQIDIHNRRIIKLDIEEDRKPYVLNVSVISIKDLQMMLLAYLLANGISHPVKRDDILKNVWDNRDLKSSSQILWATLKDLKSNLSRVGLGEDFIVSDKGSKYSINAMKVQALYMGI